MSPKLLFSLFSALQFLQSAILQFALENASCDQSHSAVYLFSWSILRPHVFLYLVSRDENMLSHRPIAEHFINSAFIIVRCHIISLKCFSVKWVSCTATKYFPFHSWKRLGFSFFWTWDDGKLKKLKWILIFFSGLEHKVRFVDLNIMQPWHVEIIRPHHFFDVLFIGCITWQQPGSFH